MATQGPKGSYIDIIASDVSIATSVSADGQTWTTFSNGSKIYNFVVQDKLYIKYSEHGSGNFKNNVMSVTNQSGTSLTTTNDNTNHYTIVTVPSGTTSINIEFIAYIGNTTEFTVVFNCKNLSTNSIPPSTTISFDIYSGDDYYTNVHVIFNKSTEVTLDNGSGHRPSFYIKNISISNVDFKVSFIDGFNYAYNNTNGARIFETGSTNYCTIYLDYWGYNYIPPTIRPKLTNVNVGYNPIITYNTPNTPIKLGEIITLKSITYSIDYDATDGQVFEWNGPSYNSTFTKYSDVNLPLTLKYSKAFRIHNNGNVFNSELQSDNKTYLATFKLSRNKNLPFYASDQEYNINTTPYTNKIKFTNTNKYNANVRLTYTNQTSGNISETIDVNNNKTIIAYTQDMFKTAHAVVIDNVWAYVDNKTGRIIDSSYFCPYIENMSQNIRYMCYDGFNRSSPFTTTQNSTPDTIKLTLLKYEFVKPVLVAPQIKTNDITLTYSSLFLTSTAYPSPISTNYSKYQFIKDFSSYNKYQGASVTLGDWSNFGYNVRNNDYKIKFELSTKDKTKYAYEFDVVNYGGNKLIDCGNNIYALKPSTTTNKYFDNVNNANINVYPKTSVKYVNKLNDYTDWISLDLSYSINSTNYSVNVNNSFETQRFTYRDNSVYSVKIDSIKKLPDNISYIQINWGNNGSKKISKDNISNGTVLLSDNNFKQQIVWESPSITYTFTLVTTAPTTKPTEAPVKYAYGIILNGNNLPDAGALSISLTDTNWKIAEYSFGKLNHTEDILTIDSSNIYNIQNIYIDKVSDTVTGSPHFYIYNYNTSYYVLPSLLPSAWSLNTQDNKCFYKANINLKNYIQYNIYELPKTQIRFNSIGVEYDAHFNVVNGNNDIVWSSSTTIPANEYKDVVIPQTYIGDEFNIVVSDISCTDNMGNTFHIDRYNLSLINAIEKTSYQIMKPIKINSTNSDVSVKITTIRTQNNNSGIWGKEIHTDLLIPNISEPGAYMYYPSYIFPREFESDNPFKIELFNNENVSVSGVCDSVFDSIKNKYICSATPLSGITPVTYISLYH